MKFVITCLPGVAALLEAELRHMGLVAEAHGGAAVVLEGETRDALQVCLYSRLAERVLLPLQSLAGDPLDAAARLGADFDWHKHLHPGADCYFRADSIGESSVTSALLGTAFLRERPAGVGLSKTPEHALCLRLVHDGDKTHLHVDLAGASLQRRGYRLHAGEAPLRETLAAAMLSLAQWPQQGAGHLVDPFCGSGTLCIEAAAMTLGIPPGLTREHYGFQGWRQGQAKLWPGLVLEARQKMASQVADTRVQITGFDANPAVVEVARRNAQRAGMAAHVDFQCKQLGVLDRTDFPGKAGLVATNPPWGERLADDDRAGWLYNALGYRLASEAPGWQAVVIADRVEMLDRLGRETLVSARIRNGSVTVYVRLTRSTVKVPASPLQPLGEPAFDVDAKAAGFLNRLRKNGKQLRRWIDRENIQAYRLYDRELPEFNLAVDVYGQQVLVQEFAAPSSVDEERAARRRTLALLAIRAALGVHREQVHMRTRKPQKGQEQYQRLNEKNTLLVIQEEQARLLVNLRDYLDTGLFLDHRPVRLALAQQARGKRFLNLFAYTGAATVQAAVGGASRTMTVDASNSYLAWAASNLALNGFGSQSHTLTRGDVMQWLRQSNDTFDLVFCDPPTFSNSKTRRDFSIQDDHAELIRLIMKRLSSEGVLYFSTNFRRFRMDPEVSRRYQLRDVTQWSMPPDFCRHPAHQCFEIRHGH